MFVGIYVHPPTVTVPIYLPYALQFIHIFQPTWISYINYKSTFLLVDPLSLVVFHAHFSYRSEDPNLASVALNRACVVLVKHVKKVQEFPSAQQR